MQWLNSKDLADLAQISKRNAQKALSLAFQEGKAWRKTTLNVRNDNGYEVELNSLPPDLQAVYRGINAPQPRTETEPAAPAPALPPPEPDASVEYSKESVWAFYERATANKKRTAQWRLTVLRRVYELTAMGLLKKKAVAQVMAEHDGKFSRPSFFRWEASIRGIPTDDWLPFLVPGHAGRMATAECDPDAWEFFRNAYLSRSKPTWAKVYEQTRQVGAARGWNIPSVKTLRRRMLREVHPDVIKLAREGEDALDTAIPSLQRDKRKMHALQAINGDGWASKAYVVFEDGEERKPVIWSWQDTYSGMILGYRIDKTENKDTIRLSLGDLVRRYGLGVGDKAMYVSLDNTRAASNKDLSGRLQGRHRWKIKDEEPIGVFALLGMDAHWTLPYRGKAKPVERKHGIGGYMDLIDSDQRLIDARNQGKGVPMAVFQEVVRSAVNTLNTRVSRSPVCAGKICPQQAFEDSYKTLTIRKATEEQLRLFLMAAERVTANKQSGAISFMQNLYWTEALARYRGDKLVIRFDPHNMHDGVFVYTLDGRYIAHADWEPSAGYADRQAARDHLRREREYKRAVKKAAQAEKRMTEAQQADQLPTISGYEPPAPAAIAPVFQMPTKLLPNQAGNEEDEDEAEDGYNKAAVIAMREELKRRANGI